MAWFAVVERGTNRLVSLGTRTAPDVSDRFDVIDLGESRPAEATEWSPASRSFVPVPVVTPVDRSQDWLTAIKANADVAAVYGALNATRRQQFDRGLAAALAPLLGRHRFRDPAEPLGVE